MLPHLDAPEVVAAGVDEVTLLDELSALDGGDPEPRRVVGEVAELVAIRGHGNLVHAEVSGPGCMGGIVRFWDRVGVELCQLPRVVGVQVHVAPTVEHRGDVDRVTHRSERGRRCRLCRSSTLSIVVTRQIEQVPTDVAADEQSRDVSLDRHVEQVAAAVAALT
ncbi:MAG: hypothetical protein KY433_10405, partial [Actinobacteria bacterium]|nr:hypothetical protein [Actinomycetota bacterium]